MIKNVVMMAMALLFVAATAPAASPTGEGPTVTEVFVFDVGPNLPKFMDLSQRADAIAKKYGGTVKARTWMATYSGPNTGNVIVTVEYPSFMSLAQSRAKINASPEWQKLVADAQASIKLVSNSIVEEIKAP